MISDDWTPHRRDDGELLGWIRPAGDDWVAVDLLGREVSAPVDWLDAEDALEERGIAWLSDAWILETADGPVRVRMVEVTPERVLVKEDDLGAVGGPPTPRYELPWPAPATLRAPRPGDPDPRILSR